jgi:hypothetical protein
MRIPALLLAALSTSAFATTVTIVPDADTTLQESAAANNFGGRTALQAGATSGATTRKRAVVSFDVGAAVPPGATIVGAHIIITATDEPAIPLTSQAFELRRVLVDWREGIQAAQNGGAAVATDVTWSHRLFPNTVWNTPGGNVGVDVAATNSAAFTVGDAGAYRIESTAALVADVQAWLDRPESNYGWILLGQNESVAQTARAFASREDAARAPYLEIEYTTETPGFRTSITRSSVGQATLNWTGGRAPYQIFTRPDLNYGAWSPVGPRIAGNSATVNLTGTRGFFTVISEPTAEYDVVFNATWSATTHPTDFPSGAHWSGLVGGCHNTSVEFWRPGATSIVGIQNVAELGSKTALLAEVNTAITAGTANRTLSGGGITGGSGTVSLRFQIDRTHPLVTLVTMVAPSPDWFAGVCGLPLIENGQWVPSKTVVLYPYDTGTDSGTTFNSANLVTTPRGVLTRIVTPPLGTNGVTPPMGTFTFTLVRIVPAP